MSGHSMKRLWLFTVLATSCAEHFPLPMTAAALSHYNSAAALSVYLSQPDASATVCDLTARGPHFKALDQEVAGELVHSLVSGNVAPRLWLDCAQAFLRSAPAGAAALLIDEGGHGYRDLIRDSQIEKSPAVQARLEALAQFYIERESRVSGHPEVLEPLFAELRKAIGEHALGQVASRLGEDLIATVDVENGLWIGRRIDRGTIDTLYKSGNEPLLHRFADRLPSRELRDEARRRVIRLRIAKSPYPELRQQRSAVEAAVMHDGVFAISLGAHPAERASIDSGRLPMRGVLVRQDVFKHTATLLGYAGDRPGVSVLPDIRLRGALAVEVRGFSKPITLCAEKKSLDVSPCIRSSDIKLENPVAYLAEGDSFHFVEHITMRDAVGLATMHDRFVLPVSIGGRRLYQFEWALSYERPQDLLFGAPSLGADGPHLTVRVDHRDPARYIFSVLRLGEAPIDAVVESADAATFRIASRGATGTMGYTGQAGSRGSDGLAGAAARCPSSTGERGGAGGPGGAGSPGGPGGRGGSGGDITLQLTCPQSGCTETLALLRTTIQSSAGEGGAGGRGGPGGTGGRGGSGGGGASCSDRSGNSFSLSSGSQGADGSDGTQGADGPPGSAGQPGRIEFSVLK